MGQLGGVHGKAPLAPQLGESEYHLVPPSYTKPATFGNKRLELENSEKTRKNENKTDGSRDSLRGCNVACHGQTSLHCVDLSSLPQSWEYGFLPLPLPSGHAYVGVVGWVGVRQAKSRLVPFPPVSLPLSPL